uniref:NS3 n=2 Tax=Bukakata virus TaxID=2547355 RepID=A0A482A254_9REOV|nr:NS3 [Bukakata virus]
MMSMVKAPQATVVEMQPMAPPQRARDVALDVLQNAMAPSSCVNETLKDEKAIYGTAAEVYRDTSETRVLKYQTNIEMIPKLEKQIGKLKFKARCYYYAQLFLALVSIAMCLIGMVESISTQLNEWLKMANATSQGIVGIITVAILYIGKQRNGIKKELVGLRRDLVKKEAYVRTAEAVYGRPRPERMDATAPLLSTYPALPGAQSY